MLFKDSFMTDAGAVILARAAAGDGAIVWTRAATSNANTDGDSVSEMNALTDIIKAPTDSYTSSGVVTSAVVNDAQTSVALYSELTNEEYDGAACTFGAWAKIHGDEEDVLVIVARCGGATPTVINPASDGVVKAFVHFTLNISAEQAQAIEATEGYYATAAALQDEIAARQDLASRVVTCHVAGQATTGEAQTIYGVKEFDDGIRVQIIVGKDSPGARTNCMVIADNNNTIYFYTNNITRFKITDNNITAEKHIYAPSITLLDSSNPSNPSITISSPIVPGIDPFTYERTNNAKLGVSDKPFNETYSYNSYVDYIIGCTSYNPGGTYAYISLRYGNSNNTGSLGYDNGTIKTGLLAWGYDGVNKFINCTCDFNTQNILPREPDEYNIGSSSNRFKYIYSKSFTGANFTGSNFTGSNFTGSNFTGSNFKADNIDAMNNTSKIGNTTPFKDIYSKNFHGCIPYATDDDISVSSNIPVGALVVLYDTLNITQRSEQIYMGEVFDCSHEPGSGETQFDGYKDRFELGSLDGENEQHNSGTHPKLQSGIFVCISCRFDGCRSFLAMKIGESTQ